MHNSFSLSLYIQDQHFHQVANPNYNIRAAYLFIYLINNSPETVKHSTSWRQLNNNRKTKSFPPLHSAPEGSFASSEIFFYGQQSMHYDKVEIFD